MADHGILGALLVPLLAYTMVRNARGESKFIGWSYAVLFLFWALTSHTVVEDRFILLTISLAAAMTKTSQLEQKTQVGT
jgi:hypothetical protein